ncbi:MAG: hypothetical protein JJ863_12490 [Deltaproteobacteria bacterium]|nr:hypothetical protein [Deltaproteobacteria bacterium]
MFRSIPFLAALICTLGCSASVANVQPARLTPEGHWQMVGSVSATPPRAMPGESLERVKAIDDTLEGRPTSNDLEEVGQAATAALVQPPSADGQLALSYGVSRRLELGARIGPTNAGAGLRLQWLRKAPGIYGVLGARVLVGFNDFPVERFTDEVRIDSFRRFDFAFPLHLGYSSRYVHLWAGPQLMISRFSSDVAICLDGTETCRQEATVSTSGRAAYLTGQLGIALGKKRFWIAFELSISRLKINADFDLEMDGRRILASHTQTGRVLTPSLGLIAWF